MAVGPIGTSDGQYYESPFHMELEDYNSSSTASTMPPGASTEVAGALKDDPRYPPTGGIGKYEELPASTNIEDRRGEPSIIPDAIEIGKGQDLIERRDKNLLTPKKRRSVY